MSFFVFFTASAVFAVGSVEFRATASGFTAGIPLAATFTTTLDCGAGGTQTFSATGQQLFDNNAPSVALTNIPNDTVCRIWQATRAAALNA